jgi:hypothetical protein
LKTKSGTKIRGRNKRPDININFFVANVTDGNFRNLLNTKQWDTKRRMENGTAEKRKLDVYRIIQ